MKKQYIFIIGAIACTNTIASQDFTNDNVYIYKQDGVDVISASNTDSISFIDPCEDFSIDSFKFETGFKMYGWKKNAKFDNWEEEYIKNCNATTDYYRYRMFSDTSAYVYDAKKNSVTAKRECDIMLKVYGRNVDRVQFLGGETTKEDAVYTPENGWGIHEYYYHEEENVTARRGEDENGQRTLIVRLHTKQELSKDETFLCSFINKAYVRGCAKPIETKGLPKVYMEPIPAEYKQLCVTMCDNEFAVKTINLYGNNFLEGTGIEVYFWNEKDADYTAKATYEIKDLNHLKVYIPENAGENHPIYLKNKYNELYTDFIYRDTRNMLITHDDEEYLNKFNGQRPDTTYVDEYTGNEIGLEEPKETIIEKYFQSENYNGNFSIFHRDGSEFVALTYEPYNSDANPSEDDPKYATPFGVFAKDILSGKTTPNDYVIKFEVFVPKDQPMQGDALIIGFYDGVSEDWVDARKYCACWQPSRVWFAKDEDGVWDPYSLTCEAWSTSDWMTVTIPMEELRYDFQQANYRANPQGNRLATDGYDSEFAYYGDKVNGLPFFAKNSDYKDLFDAKSPADLGDASITGLSIVMSKWDCPEYNTNGRHPYIAVDNVRIVPKDNNGGVWPMLKWGVPTREFNLAPVYCGKSYEEESDFRIPDCWEYNHEELSFPIQDNTLDKPVVDKSKHTINNHEYVDLGLPSGNLWATMNVGASSSSEYGDYYSFGEVKTKNVYDESTSEVFGLSQTLLAKKGIYNAENQYEDYTCLTCYNFSFSPKSDAATMNWGNGWQLPNGDDFEELFYECEWTWTNLDGVNGYVVKSKQKGNDNSIFLPAAGMKVKNGTARDSQWGRYLSSNLNFSGYGTLTTLSFDKKFMETNSSAPIVNGFSVRPVAKIK